MFSTQVVVDDTGAVEESFRYEEFGQSRVLDDTFTALALWAPSPLGNIFRFTGRPFASQASPSGSEQWFDYRARHYSASLGVFTQRDSSQFVDGSSLYQYVRGNPLTHTDPSGKTTVVPGGALRDPGPGVNILPLTGTSTLPFIPVDGGGVGDGRGTLGFGPWPEVYKTGNCGWGWGELVDAVTWGSLDFPNLTEAACIKVECVTDADTDVGNHPCSCGGHISPHAGEPCHTIQINMKESCGEPYSGGQWAFPNLKCEPVEAEVGGTTYSCPSPMALIYHELAHADYWEQHGSGGSAGDSEDYAELAEDIPCGP